MSDLDWSKAPEGAETYELHLRGVFNRFCKQGMWFSEHDKVWYVKTDNADWQLIATRPTESERKTVKDAVDYYNGKLPTERNPESDVVVWHVRWENFYFVSKSFADSNKDLETVCTRAEFEAEVERQKERQKWTHEYCGDSCYVKCGEPDIDGFIVIVTREDGYMLVEPADIQSIAIKPKITQEQADSIIAAAAAWGVDADDCQDYLLKFSVTGHDESLEF